jgi:iron complex transport system ATP-binding protein
MSERDNVLRNPSSALQAQDVVVRYPKSQDLALSGVSLRVDPGSLVAVLGPNGAGKSTLVKVMTGVLCPDQGRLSLFGEDLSALSPRQIARRVAVVPQDVRVAFGFSVRDVVTMGRAPHQGAMLVSSKQDHDVVEHVLARTNLIQLADRPVGGLSGGEQKRVAVARALAQQPDVLVLDEATAHLDIRHRVGLHALVRREIRERKLACMAVMHDLNEAAQNADIVVLMDRGTIRAQGAVEDVMTYRTLRDIFDVELYVGVNELDGTRYFIPMRESGRGGSRNDEVPLRDDDRKAVRSPRILDPGSKNDL